MNPGLGDRNSATRTTNRITNAASADIPTDQRQSTLAVRTHSTSHVHPLVIADTKTQIRIHESADSADLVCRGKTRVRIRCELSRRAREVDITRYRRNPVDRATGVRYHAPSSGKGFSRPNEKTVLTAGTIDGHEDSGQGKNHNRHFGREKAIGSSDQISPRSTVAISRTHDGVSSIP